MQELWWEKYRAKTLQEFVWFDSDTRWKVERWIANPHETPHLILAGPSGLGKTSLLRMLPNLMGIAESDVFVRNASKDNGVDLTRVDIPEFCELGGWSAIKMVCLDEAERLTQDAQEMLRGLIEEYGAHVRFGFTCNEIRRIRPALQSRCRVIKMKELDRAAFSDRLIDILVAEQIIDPEAPDESILVPLNQIIARHYPDMRKSIDMLQDSWNGSTLTVSQEAATEGEWQAGVIEVFKTGQNVSRARELLNAVRPEEIEEFYRYLYENGSLYVDEGLAMVVIGDHLYKHTLVPFPEINLLACLVRLDQVGFTKE